MKFIGAGLNNIQASKDFIQNEFVVINCNFVSSEKKVLNLKLIMQQKMTMVVLIKTMMN